MIIWIITGIVFVAVLLCALLAIANNAGEKFFDRFKEVDEIEVRHCDSPLKFVANLNREHFNNQLKIVQVSSIATDAYSKGNLFLSTSTINKNSVASYTIIAHEVGHALQDTSGKKLKRLVALRRLGRLLGSLFIPFIVAGITLILFELIIWGIALLGLGGGILLLALIIKLRTVAIEKDASLKAIQFLKEYLTENELKDAKKLLKDAKLTYWADFLRLLLWWTGMSKKSKLFN